MEQENRDSEDAGSTKSSISINEPETQSDLLVKLLALLSIEKVPGMMAVRKGRVSSSNAPEIQALHSHSCVLESTEAHHGTNQRTTGPLGHVERHFHFARGIQARQA